MYADGLICIIVYTVYIIVYTVYNEKSPTNTYLIESSKNTDIMAALCIIQSKTNLISKVVLYIVIKGATSIQSIRQVH